MFMRFIVRLITLTLLAVSTGPGAQQAPAVAPVAAPIVIDSVNNEYDLRNGLTRFYDDVSIERGNMKVSADEGVVRQADGEIASIELSGNPTTWEDRLEDGSLVQGEARRIHFDVQKNVVTLTVGARIRHEKGEFTGDKLIYDLDTENLVGRGSADNRARVVIDSEAMRRRDTDEAPAEAPIEAPTDTSGDPADEPSATPEATAVIEDRATDEAARAGTDSGVEEGTDGRAPETRTGAEDPIDPPDAG